MRMTYSIKGLDPAAFAFLVGADAPYLGLLRFLRRELLLNHIMRFG